MWVHDHSTGKLGIQMKKGYWVGFDHQTNRHRIYWPEKHTVRVEKSVVFSETHIPVPHDVGDVELEGGRMTKDQMQRAILTSLLSPVTPKMHQTSLMNQFLSLLQLLWPMKARIAQTRTENHPS